MKCGKVRRNLMAFHDGELGKATGKKVSRHLESCIQCSGILAEFEKADYAASPPDIPGPGSPYWDAFTGRVMERVKGEATAGRQKSEEAPAPSRFLPIRFAPALSVALVVVVAAGVLMKMRGPVVPAGEQEPVVGEGVFQVRQERPLTDLESEGIMERSTPEQGPHPPVPVIQVDEAQGSKAAPSDLMDSESVKKEAEAGEREASGTIRKEIGTLLAGRDDSLTAVEKSPAGLETARSTRAVPSQEPAEGHEHAEITDELLSAAGSIDDGSWGQLAFAGRLEEEGRHVESEKVLDDLLARHPAGPVQEQASILLVRVLMNQKRLPEARKVLEEAQRQYPGNMMIQNYRIGDGE